MRERRERERGGERVRQGRQGRKAFGAAFSDAGEFLRF